MACEHKVLVGKSRQLSDISADDENKDIKWDSLTHNGVYFPEEYVTLPNNVKLLYDGKRIDLDSKDTDNKLNLTQEECAVFFATKLVQDERLAEKQKNRKLAKNDPGFVKNFFEDWKIVLGKNHIIKDWEKIDFSEIKNYIIKKSEEKKSKTKEEKQEEKKIKDDIKEIYGYAVVDGYRSALGAWTVQPPGLYIGHGTHPKRGRIKGRLRPRDVTINCTEGKAPKCSVRGKPCIWGQIIEDKTVTWIAGYKNPVTNLTTYVYLDRKESKWVCASDKVKFDKAKKLKENINSIRAVYNSDLDSESSITIQCAVAVYFLDRLAIRPGAEKDEKEESDTVGLTTLKCENIKFLTDNNIELKFVGKSSIEFQKKFKIDFKVYNILKELCKSTDGKSEIFKYVSADVLNDYLKKIVPDLTAKVFRTWKACSTLQNALDGLNVDIDNSVSSKKEAFDRANIQVAEALNHKALTQNDNKVTKIEEKIKDLEEKMKDTKTDNQKQKIEERITKLETDLEAAKGNISLTTSKVNYIDPRIIVSWCKRIEMPIEKIYTKTSLKKFIWAMQIDSGWKF